MDRDHAGTVQYSDMKPAIGVPYAFARPMREMPQGLRTQELGVYTPGASSVLKTSDGRKYLKAIKQTAPRIYDAFSSTLDDQLFLANLALALQDDNIQISEWESLLDDPPLKELCARLGVKHAVYAKIDEQFVGAQDGRKEFLFRQAQVKSRGYNVRTCIDILENALGIPTEMWEQLLMVEYFYASQLNKVGMAMYPGEVAPLASPYYLKAMRDKLSETGKRCLEANPKRAAGEPQYKARCFRPGITEPGADGSIYVSTSYGTWQRISSDQPGADASTAKRRLDEQEAFNEDVKQSGWKEAERILGKHKEM